MTAKRSSGLSPSVEALLAEERVPPTQPDLVRERLLSRARTAVLQEPAPLPVHTARHTFRRSFAMAATATVLLIGVAAAFQLRNRSSTTAPPASKPSLVAPAISASPPVTEPTATSSAASEAAPALPSASSHRPSPSSRVEGGAEELQLLSRARQSAAQGDYAGVLALVREHERSFPSGRLSEEREVLRLKALVGLGRGDEARRAAARFHTQFPRSVLLRRIDEMLTSLP